MKKIIFCILILSGIISFSKEIKFDLNAYVFDYGQNIISVEIDKSQFNNEEVDLTSLDTETFKIHAKGEPPINTGNNKAYGIFDIKGETKALGVYDVDREITAVKLNNKGNLVIELKHGQGVEGANTLAYYTGDISRNVLLKISYTVQQQKDFNLKSGRKIEKNTKYIQNKIRDEEADKLVSRKSKGNMNYQFYAPENRKNEKLPLIIWFHGNGEGGYKDYKNNVSQKLANRGAVTFVTDETQKIFGGKAYVVAPQADDTWYNNYSKNYIKTAKSLIDEVVANNNIDKERIYVFGASAGGYMSLRMTMEYPKFFAGVNVSAPALDIAPKRGGVETTVDDIKKLKGTPIWLVHAENDPTIEYSKTSKIVYEELKKENEKVFLNVYPDVKIGEKEYNGHWSWIYSLRNLPLNSNRESLFDWMSKQRLKK